VSIKMNRLVLIIGVFIGIVPSTTWAASAFFKKKSSSHKQSKKDKGSNVVRRLKAALTIKKDRTVTPVTSPGFLAGAPADRERKSPKTPDALTQVRRQPSDKPPFKLEVHSPAVSPTPLSASSHDLISPLASTSSSSGKSALSALSSPSSVSSASVVGSLSPSPGVETALATAIDIPGMLHESPAIEPLNKKHSSDEFILPGAAHKVLSQSQQVHDGSIEEEPLCKNKPLAGGCMRDELLDGSEPIPEEIDRALLQQTMTEVLSLTPVVAGEVVIRQVMEAAQEGNVEAIEKMKSAFEKELAAMPYREKIQAFKEIQGTLCDVQELLEKNPVLEHEEDEDAQYEREVLKPLGSQGRPKWFKHYVLLRELGHFPEVEDQLGPDWEVADVQEALKKNPSNTVLQEWYDAHLKARQGLNADYPYLSPEYHPDYEQLKRQHDAYAIINDILADLLVDGLIIPARVPVHVREATEASFQ